MIQLMKKKKMFIDQVHLKTLNFEKQASQTHSTCAVDSLEFYLDKASLANLACVTIIHGHGTGALKSAVRDFLTTSPYVAKWRVGEDSEGGDGVSIVDIN